MKNGQIEASLTVTDEDLAEVNKFTRRAFSADEIYTFSVVLCDNDVDRDFERFTVETLKKLSNLFVGKTGIADHSGKSSDQCARIYFCEVITDENRKTVYGEPYTYIKAKAYMPKTEKLADLITEIDAGIKKELFYLRKRCSPLQPQKRQTLPQKRSIYPLLSRAPKPNRCL